MSARGAVQASKAAVRRRCCVRAALLPTWARPAQHPLTWPPPPSTPCLRAGGGGRHLGRRGQPAGLFSGPLLPAPARRHRGGHALHAPRHHCSHPEDPRQRRPLGRPLSRLLSSCTHGGLLSEFKHLAAATPGGCTSPSSPPCTETPAGLSCFFPCLFSHATLARPVDFVPPWTAIPICTPWVNALLLLGMTCCFSLLRWRLMRRLAQERLPFAAPSNHSLLHPSALAPVVTLATTLQGMRSTAGLPQAAGVVGWGPHWPSDRYLLVPAAAGPGRLVRCR